MPRRRTVSCEECGHLLLKRAETCERCGAETLYSRRRFWTWLAGFGVTALVVLVAVVLIRKDIAEFAAHLLH
jgi:uncharacterized paraquat-inducible protein A